MIRQVLICFLLLLLSVHSVFAANIFSKHRFGQKSAVLVVDAQGRTLYSKNASKALIPASTIKIATSIAAIDKFGLDYRFSTDFFVRDDVLWVKGYGDPYLISEELDIVAKQVLQRLNQEFLSISKIKVDGTHFPLLKVPGRKISSQPYDAPLAAVSANFNTIKIRKKGSKISSAEQQTPITPLAKKLARGLSDGVHRINLVGTAYSEQYFAELMAAKLKEHGLKKNLQASTGLMPLDVKFIYKHENSKSIEDALRAVLYYSNNFIANQLFLQLREKDSEVGFASSSEYVLRVLSEEVNTKSDGTTKAKIAEGSGLSRNNKLTAEHLIALLVRFKEHKKLMKSYLDGKAYAKSGSLNGVHNLAGYITKNNKDYYFAFFFNETVPWRYRNTLLKELYATL